MALSFRHAHKEDENIFITHMKTFYAIDGYPIDEELSKSNFHHFINNPNLGQLFMIEYDGVCCGYIIIIYLFSFEFGGTILLADELYVDAAHRGLGIGNAAVTYIQNHVVEKGYKRIFLEVENHNIRAIELYKKHDFKMHHRSLMLYKP